MSRSLLSTCHDDCAARLQFNLHPAPFLTVVYILEKYFGPGSGEQGELQRVSNYTSSRPMDQTSLRNFQLPAMHHALASGIHELENFQFVHGY